MSPSFRKLFTFLLQQNNLQDLLGESHKKLNVIVATVLLLVAKKDKSYSFKSVSLHLLPTYEKFAY